MFGHRYFGGRYFGPRYFGDGGSAAPPVVTETGAGAWLWSWLLMRRRSGVAHGAKLRIDVYLTPGIATGGSAPQLKAGRARGQFAATELMALLAEIA